jgi:hypothetical protein
MSISRATEHLAKHLRNHFLRVNPEDMAIRLIEEVARIGEFRDAGNLDAWENAVLKTYSDKEWDVFERRDDFEVIESVWEVGRFNMYGAIDEKGTKQFYQQAANKVKSYTGFSTFEADRFDFSKW